MGSRFTNEELREMAQNAESEMTRDMAIDLLKLRGEDVSDLE